MSLSYDQQLKITIIDKFMIGMLLLVAGFAFNRMLEGFKSQQTRALESLKNDLSRQSELDRQRREAIADLATRVSGAYHAMEWLTWNAKYDSQSFSVSDIDEYNATMAARFPQIAAARVVASAIDSQNQSAYGRLARQVGVADSELAKLCVAFRQAVVGSEAHKAALKAISESHETVSAEDRGFVDSIIEIAGSSKSR